MKRNDFVLVVLAAALAAVLASCALAPAGIAKAEIPVDKAYAEGKEVYFTHTEVSNADLARQMELGMKSPVLYVPSLADVPQDAQANVYVFTNGVKGGSMSGFQLSVFDNPPGQEGYTPLRRLNVVTWIDEVKARELKSPAEIKAAADAGELTVKQPGVVVNMPFIMWDGGKR